jgi:hypothetical protein
MARLCLTGAPALWHVRAVFAVRPQHWPAGIVPCALRSGVSSLECASGAECEVEGRAALPITIQAAPCTEEEAAAREEWTCSRHYASMAKPQ